MKVNYHKVTFKGYDAAPLKNLYCQTGRYPCLKDELIKIGEAENFGLRTIDNIAMSYAQDYITAIEKDGQACFLTHRDIQDPPGFVKQMKQVNSADCFIVRDFLTGGETFIGKYPNGEKWIIASKKDVKKYVKNLDELANSYGVKKENIHLLPNQDFHLDMTIRPVGYPYVLVNDPEMAQENLKELFDDRSDLVFCQLDMDEKKSELAKHDCYVNCDEMCEALSQKGFIPIRIGAVYGNPINFMNAVVNKHSDGTISYITNSCSSSIHPEYIKLQEKFEEDLRKLLPNVDKVYFVKGKNLIESGYNYAFDTLKFGHGGIHCMTSEEPRFDEWV